MPSYSLPDLPPTFQTTRDHLHQLAFFALSPVRHRAEGRMGLRHHEGGFGTPEFGGKVLRVDGDRLIVDEGGAVDSHEIATVREAIEFLGHDYDRKWFADFGDPLDPVHPDARLEIDPVSTSALSEWFEFGWVLLDELRAHGTKEDDVSEVQLWPEHFDVAAELGSLESGERASYGASPGDRDHPEPYVYVSAWGEIDRSNPYWNDTSFNGSSLSYRELTASDDPIAAALEFLLRGYRILHGG